MSEQRIKVIRRIDLETTPLFEGFIAKNGFDYLTHFENAGFFMTRDKVEKDVDFIQPIPYVIFINQKKQVFAYQRAKAGKDYGEKRLESKWSIGIGGHVEDSDVVKDHGFDSPIINALQREIREELPGFNQFKLKQYGYLYSKADDVSRVHFGFICLAFARTNFIPTNKEIVASGFMSFEELEKLPNLENWSKALLPQVKTALMVETAIEKNWRV